jgi:hypothetical protein
VFSPYGNYDVALQPKGGVTFNAATTAMGLSSAQNTEIRAFLTHQAQVSGSGQGIPTDAAWITKSVTLEAGKTYTMAWNFIATDYVPYNDGSILSLVYQGQGASTVTVNGQAKNYGYLGFINPGTGDYSTNSYGSTGWQTAVYTVSTTGDYLIGFTVFNLDDSALSPVLLVDDVAGTVTKNGNPFAPVPPNTGGTGAAGTAGISGGTGTAGALPIGVNGGTGGTGGTAGSGGQGGPA